MDYDTQIFKVPKIYKHTIDFTFKRNGLMYSNLGGTEEFKNLILKYERILSNVASEDRMVFVGSGVSSLIGLAVEAILGLPENVSRKDIILFSPDYPLFHSAVELAAGNPTLVYSRRENDYLPTIDEISKSITTKTAAVIFSNPNNPTGKNYSFEWLNDLVALSEKKNFFIVSDEIYSEMLFEPNKFVRIEEIKNNYKNFIKLFGPSKDRPGMTGMRIGYCIGDTRLFEPMCDIQMVRNFSGNILSEVVFLIDIALRYFALSKTRPRELKYCSDRDIEDYYTTIKKNRIIQKQSIETVIFELKGNPNVADIILPDGGNDVFFKYYKTLPAMDLLYEFINKGLAVYPTDSFNMDPAKEGSWIRICATQNIDFLKNCISKI